jgi:hypothetical protein
MRVFVRLKRDLEEHQFIFARNKVERELNKRLEQDIIERIEGTPTSWVLSHLSHVLVHQLLVIYAFRE